MSATKHYVLSVVVPVFNEAVGLPKFHAALVTELNKMDVGSYEIIYCNDGSTDDTVSVIEELSQSDSHTKLLSLSRNFGKEIATTAGIHYATGEAIVTIDGDGQHPVELLRQFVERWKAGAKVVVGRRVNYQTTFTKRLTSKLFYRFFKLFTGVTLLPEATDFRLIDHTVQRDFKRMTERSRMTRALIDWLGYEREYVSYTENPRIHGDASYSFGKLFKLAIDSVISTSTSPLYIAMYIGVIVLPLSIILGGIMLIDAMLGDPLGIHATGSAYVVTLMLFLIGVLLVSQGIIGLYLSQIHTETQNRPLYIVDDKNSKGIA